MFVSTEVFRSRDSYTCWVTLSMQGDVPEDSGVLRTTIEDDELSSALWEAGTLAHAWWRHGLLGIQCLSPKMYEWRWLLVDGGAPPLD